MKFVPSRLFLTLLSCIAIYGCADRAPLVPAPLDFPRSADTRISGNFGAQPVSVPKVTQIAKGPKPPAPIAGNLRPASPKVQLDEAAGDLSVSFDQMALPAFIQSVYGGILKVNYSIDAAVSARTDLITFRTPKALSAAKLQDVTAQLLKSYGIAVQDFGGVLRIVPSSNIASTIPMVIRGRAQPSVPVSMRPVFYYIETESVRAANFLPTLKTIFGDKVKFDADSYGGVFISGQPDDVQVALELVQVFDQPSLKSYNSSRVVPRYWGADEFARRLGEVLRAEGYGVSSQAAGGEPISLLALPPINSVLIFASSKDVMGHVLDWVKELDQLTAVQAGSAFFTYPVRNADAQELAKSLNELITGNATVPTSSVGGTPAPTAGIQSKQKRVVVNSATNSLIFQGGTQEDYRQWLSLLAELDRPVKSALIDVLVAEVALADNNDLGFAWQLDKLGAGAQALSLEGTTYSLAASGSGLAVNALLGGSTMRTLAISALASNSDSRVISNPKIMTRNGESATISVGQDVPTVTSQGITTANGVNNTNVVPQTIQYRNTGILLRVRPVIHAGDRIDLEVSQEVSSAEPTTTGVTSSPTIRRRAIDTKLTVRDGATVMLGGLISENRSDSDSGVPFLKDLPGVGALFKKRGQTKTRTELVVLITPYIINDSTEAEAATDAFNVSLGTWADGVRDRVKASRIARDAVLKSTAEALRSADTSAQRPAVAETPKGNESINFNRVSGESAPVSDESGRMINFNSGAAAPVDSQSVQSSTNMNGGAGSQGRESLITSPSPAKQAPARVNGVAVPQGSTVVEDPALIREILDAAKRR